jgi:hypothetical protein
MLYIQLHTLHITVYILVLIYIQLHTIIIRLELLNLFQLVRLDYRIFFFLKKILQYYDTQKQKIFFAKSFSIFSSSCACECSIFYITILLKHMLSIL